MFLFHRPFHTEDYAQSSRLARQVSQHQNRESYSCGNPNPPCALFRHDQFPVFFLVHHKLVMPEKGLPWRLSKAVPIISKSRDRKIFTWARLFLPLKVQVPVHKGSRKNNWASIHPVWRRCSSFRACETITWTSRIPFSGHL